MWETANKLARGLAQTKHRYISRIRHTQTGRCRECKKFLLRFVAKGSANFLWMISRCSFHPFFLLSSLEPPTHSLLLTFLTHSFNEACTQTSSTRSSLFYESTSSSLLSLYVVYPSLFPPYLLVLFSSHHAGHPLCLGPCISRMFLLRVGVQYG